MAQALDSLVEAASQLDELLTHNVNLGHTIDLENFPKVGKWLASKRNAALMRSKVAQEKGGKHVAYAADAHNDVANELEKHGFLHLADQHRTMANKHGATFHPGMLMQSIESLVQEGTALLERSLQSLQNKENRRNWEKKMNQGHTAGMALHQKYRLNPDPLAPPEPKRYKPVGGKLPNSVLKRQKLKQQQKKNPLAGQEINWRAAKLAKLKGEPEPTEIRYAKKQLD